MTEDYLDERWLLEEGTAHALVDALNLYRGTQYVIISHSDKPDMVIEDLQTGERLRVEITQLFYDAEHAMMIFGRGNGPLEHSPEYLEGYIERLNELLLQEAETVREYECEYPLALLIRVVSPVFHTYDLQAYAADIMIPPSNFKHIWLMFYDIAEKRWALLEDLLSH